MSICETQSISTDTDLNATFGNGTIVGVLPSAPNPSSDRDDKGKLTQSALSTIITTLKANKIPSPTSYEPEEFIRKQDELIQNLKLEYCFYESRYKYALEKLFKAVSDGYRNNTDASKAAIATNYLEKTRILNLRLNDLTQIINAITENMLSTSDSIQNEITKYKATLEKQKKSLDKQNEIINKGDAVTNIRKEMVKYTEEKAKYTDNLLKLYSFLNIVTLGLLVYIYKAAGNE